ncbi:NAD(P)-binding protein [Karstenula rhodostoma CBS 690.94]|uniref:NAD(P)-binding protein n=1 Tax=Karstenula rhodostoma CBS 690.94 TaxID=1392251 RepID=A0A9P4PFW3_9PLEO|nr:NAD(P)-binding protein [Karstenula rhodostoma CBS 690.94]
MNKAITDFFNTTTRLAMPILQAPVAPLPEGICLRGQTAIVTGASNGIGTEIVAQLLEREISTVILAVRNVAKGEAARTSLLARPSVKKANPKAVLKVMELEVEDYASVQRFTKAFLAEHSELHLLLLNAGIGVLKRDLVSNGHEKHIQVNYLSNVLILLELLPLLNATADKTGKPTRVTWTGSRMHSSSALAKGKVPIKPGETVLGHFDSEDSYVPFARYADSKLLCLFFLFELRKHLNGDKVIQNSFCPGMVNTGMSDVLPIYLRLPMNLVKAIRARSVEVAGWTALNAAVVVGPESHGQFLLDKDIVEPSPYVKTAEGQKVQKMLWNETVDEMSKLTTIPSWMTKV